VTCQTAEPRFGRWSFLLRSLLRLVARYCFRNSSGSFAMLAAILRASSPVSSPFVPSRLRPERTAQHQSRSPHPRRQIDCRRKSKPPRSKTEPTANTIATEQPCIYKHPMTRYVRRNSPGSFATLAAIRRVSSFVNDLPASLLVPTKYVPDAGSYGEHAQCFMYSKSFSDPRRVLSEDMHLLWSSRPVPEESD